MQPEARSRRSQKPEAKRQKKKKTQMPNKIPLHAELKPLELHNR